MYREALIGILGLVFLASAGAGEEAVFRFEKEDVVRTKIFPQEDGSRMIVHQVRSSEWPVVAAVDEGQVAVPRSAVPAAGPGGVRKAALMSVGASVYREDDGGYWSEARVDGEKGEKPVRFQVRENLGLLAMVPSLRDEEGREQILMIHWSEIHLPQMEARMKKIGQVWQRPRFGGSEGGIHWLEEPSAFQKASVERWVGELRRRRAELEQEATRRAYEVKIAAEEKAWKEAQPGARDVHLFHWTEVVEEEGEMQK